VSTFTVSYPLVFYAIDIGVIAVFFAIGAFLAFRPLRQKYTGQLYRKQKTIKGVGLAALAVVLLVFLYFTGVLSPTPSVIINGDQIVLSASPYVTRTVDADMVTGAYVTNMNNGNFTLSSPGGVNWGTATWGDFMLGKYTLDNRAPAYVITGQSEIVVMSLSDGSYLVMGPSDFGVFVSALQTTFLNHTIPTRA
jgi:hypothetical protein